MQNKPQTLLVLVMTLAMVSSPAASTVFAASATGAGAGGSVADDVDPSVVETTPADFGDDGGAASSDTAQSSGTSQGAQSTDTGSLGSSWQSTDGSWQAGDGSPEGASHGTGSPAAIVNALKENGIEGVKEQFGWSKSDRKHDVTQTQFNQPSEGAVCPADAPVRTFNVTAFSVDIVYNKYGQHDPEGVMYALDRNVKTIKQKVANSPNATIKDPDPNATTRMVQPLTLRANKGDCIKINFENGIRNVSASMHVSGLPFNVSQSDGMAVGDNPRSFARYGEEVQYTYYASNRGTHFFGDAVNVAENSDPDRETSQGSLRSHGLFGSIVVEPKDVSWVSPRTGDPIENGTRAMIKDPDGPDHREFVIYYHDGADVVNADGEEPTWPHTNATQSLYTMNYRGDPMSARLKSDCPDCDVPENFYSSWVHGDPGGGDLVYNAYVGDPLKMRLVGAQSEENHVHHQHGHRWKSTPRDPKSNTIDSQTITPGGTYEAIYNAGFGPNSVRPNLTYAGAFAKGGAGYVQKSAGDYIFHCHLFPHYASGMWAILRVNDAKRANLKSLPDRDDPPKPTKKDPGYWNPKGPGPDSFVNGTIGHEPPNPPDPQLRPPTQLEKSAIDGTGITDPIVPGAPYSDPCPANASERHYNVTVFQTNITYNNAGDYDDTAWMFALKKNVQAIKNGSMRPRPLAIRANLGDCVTINLTNQLPEDVEPNRISMHIHFVGYDTLGSDGVTLGYNYDEGVEPGEKIRYRWYADEKGTIFWHDHLSGIEKGMHGLFGSLIVEPRNATWLDPYTGQPTDGDGTQAIIEVPNGSDFREQMLFYQDFARLHDGDTGEPLNGPHSKDLEDQGVMGINFANAPMYRRDAKGPAYTFSSWIHGDPQTPIIEAYQGDPVRIRLLQGVFEEQHNFQIHGLDWRKEWNDPDSPRGTSQTVGTSEQFQFRFQAPADNDFPVHDYLYGSFTQSDLWNGMWGIFRVWTQPVWHLQPLPDRGYPNTSYSTNNTTLSSSSTMTTGGDDGMVTEEDTDEQADKVSNEPLRVTNPKNDTDTSGDGLTTSTTTSSTSYWEDWPPKAPGPGDPCPKGATTRVYNVTAFHHNISYNDEGDHDPHGLVYALDSQVQAIKNGSMDEKPLVLRANKGDCIEVNLTNDLDRTANNNHPHAEVPVNQDWNYSHRISLHAKGVQYDVLGSDGATVGLNFDQTVDPGNSRTYRWYAANETGAQVIWDMADVRSHRHHGSYGMLIVEPENSTWLDAETGEPTRTATRAIIDMPDDAKRDDFREFAMLWADGKYVVNPSGKCVVPLSGEEGESDAIAADELAPCNQRAGDAEDQGFKGLNYASEPFRWRFEDNDSEAWVFSSKVHGDPSTPVMTAYRDDPVVFRVGQGADKRRGVTVQVSGHEFHQFWRDDESPVKGTYSLTPGGNMNIQPRFDAGGFQNQAGDYLVRSMKLRNYLEGGLWSIFRVEDDPADVAPLPDRQPGTPAGLDAVGTNDSVELTWMSVASADIEGYVVYRMSSSDDDYERVGFTTTTGYVDDSVTSGEAYAYVVRAVDDDGNLSPESVPDRAVAG